MGGTGSPAPPPEVGRVLDAVDRALPFLSVTTTPSAATVWCADVVAHVRAGQDPLAPWRHALGDQMSRRHGVEAPPHVPAAFVLQWWCEVVATLPAYAAVLGPWVLAPDPGSLGFELAPGLHPQRLVVEAERVRLDHVADPTTRAALARTAYRDGVDEIVAAFAPEVRMGSRQRWGVVDDVWAMTTRTAQGAAGHETGPEARRVSCCFIYALPGMRECAACPRSGSPAPGSGRARAGDPPELG